MMGVLFHGSPKKLALLKPARSLLIENAEVVFATPSRWLALVFCAHTTSRELDFGFVNGVPYIAELHEGAFSLLKTHGYIHTVAAHAFHSDSRVGMRDHEFVSAHSVPVLEREYIEDIYTDLRRFDNLKMLTYAEHLAALAAERAADARCEAAGIAAAAARDAAVAAAKASAASQPPP
jgi:hypothetical protein